MIAMSFTTWLEIIEPVLEKYHQGTMARTYAGMYFDVKRGRTMLSAALGEVGRHLSPSARLAIREAVDARMAETEGTY